HSRSLPCRSCVALDNASGPLLTFTCSRARLTILPMAGPGLQQVQRLSLQQILAPQLQQSLHLLQVPTLELQSLVQEELQQNPLLEEVSKDEPRVEVEAPSSEADDETARTKDDQDFKEE